MLTNVTELLTVFLVFRNRLVYETPASDICNLATVFFTLIMFCVSIGLLIIMTGLVPEGPWLILVSLPAALLRLGVDNFRCRHHFFAYGATAIVIPAAQPAYGLKYHIECLWILPSRYLNQGATNRLHL